MSPQLLGPLALENEQGSALPRLYSPREGEAGGEMSV